jgi:hypothetical protein
MNVFVIRHATKYHIAGYRAVVQRRAIGHSVADAKARVVATTVTLRNDRNTAFRDGLALARLVQA